MTWQPYPEYRDSGVEWLGEIPEEWEVIRVKALEGNSSSVVQTGPFGAQLHASDYVEQGVPLILIRNVADLRIDDTDIPRVTDEDAERLSMYRLEPGDTVFSRVGSIGRIALCTEREKGWLISGQMLRLRVRNPRLNSRFSMYALSSESILTFVDLQSVGSTRESINTDVLRNMPVVLPPIDEQRAIAAFLDRETEHIDALIARKEHQLELLQEKRVALISHAVTKGLDPNAPMKDSDIEWLGEIPAHWEVVRVKALEGNSSSVVQTGPFGAQLHASDYVDEGVPLILIGNVDNLRIDDTGIPHVTHEDAKRLAMYRLDVGDIVFSRVGSIGRIAACTEKERGWLISGQMLRLRIRNPQLDSRYSIYAFSSDAVLTFVSLQSVGSTRESINTDILRNMPLPVPSASEQQAIADYLDDQTGYIDKTVEKVQKSIVQLREYRTSLISAAVTGKIDVRGEA